MLWPSCRVFPRWRRTSSTSTCRDRTADRWDFSLRWRRLRGRRARGRHRTPSARGVPVEEGAGEGFSVQRTSIACSRSVARTYRFSSAVSGFRNTRYASSTTGFPRLTGRGGTSGGKALAASSVSTTGRRGSFSSGASSNGKGVGVLLDALGGIRRGAGGSSSSARAMTGPFTSAR